MDARTTGQQDPRPGERWVVRHRLPDGSATDVVGWVASADAARLRIQVAPGTPVRAIDTHTIVTARRAPAAAGGPDPRRISAAELERIALPGWLAEHEPLGEWTLRAAGGFTGRANSCLAVGDPGMPYADAAERIRRYSATHGIEPWAQVVQGSIEEQGLRDLGWRPTYVATAVLVVRLADLLGRTLLDPSVAIDERLSEEWLAGYHASRPNDADPRLLRMILEGSPPRAFAAAGDRDGLFAIGRGHLERSWLGIASVWTRADRRRQGWSTKVLLALGHWAARHGARYAYLQVAEQNAAAVLAYERMGFRRHHGYGYFVSPADVLSLRQDPQYRTSGFTV